MSHVLFSIWLMKIRKKIPEVSDSIRRGGNKIK